MTQPSKISDHTHSTRTQSNNIEKYAIIRSKDYENVADVVDRASIPQPLVAVYCGSRLGNNDVYAQAATALGKALADNGMGLVYGGASIGLMGAVADGIIAAGAAAIGVIPNFMLDHEVAHHGLTRLHLTDTMHTRKAIMAEYADAFITLPGGFGTLEEIMEIATWRQLYQHEKPMIILNINGFYDHLIEHLKHTAEQGFMKPEDLERLVVCHDIDAAINLLNSVVSIRDSLDTNKI